METRMEIVKKIGRILSVALLLGVASQVALPTAAHAKRAKCFSTPVPGQPGVFIGKCTTSRP